MKTYNLHLQKRTKNNPVVKKLYRKIHMVIMESSGLWEDARSDFEKKMHKTLKNSRDCEILKEFLSGQETPESVQQSAMELAAKAEGEWIGKHIPKRWADKIMTNMEAFIKATNSGMDFAPESVKLVWFGVNRVLSAIQSDYELYAMFGTGLMDITDVMLIILHYDRLYSKHTPAEAGFKQNSMLNQLFKTIKDAYCAVLEFSFSVKRYLNSSFGKKVVNAVRHLFSTAKDSFTSILSTIELLKNTILQTSQSIFQKISMDTANSIKNTLADIQTFDHKSLQDMKKDQNEYFSSVLKKLEGIATSTKPKTPFEMAVQELEGNMARLEASGDTTSALYEALHRAFPGTCRWLLEDQTYKVWNQSQKDSMLLLTGDEGSGKSVALATVVEHLGTEVGKDASKSMIIYFSCKTKDANTGMKSMSAEKVLNELLYQLCWLLRTIAEESSDVELIQGCNKAFRPDHESKNLIFTTQQNAGEKQPPEFVGVFNSIASRLKINLVLALDNVDSLGSEEQKQLGSSLEALFKKLYQTNSRQTWVKMLIGWRSKQYTSIEGKEPSNINVGQHNREDMKMTLLKGLESVVGLRESERNEAVTEILKKASSRFAYINEIGIPFMREPFQPPLKNHLKSLPEGMKTIYSDAILRMNKSYVGLLKEALKWCLSSTISIPTELIMDSYRGTYLPSSEHTTRENGQEISASQRMSSLEIEQLRHASGPFLDIDANNFVSLRDAAQIRDFCFNFTKMDDPVTGLDKRTCMNCKNSMIGSPAVQMSERECYLQIALTCLRHMTNPVFQSMVMATDTTRRRYEVLYWWYYLKQAETLWMPHERKGNVSWEEALMHLHDLFTPSNPVCRNFLKWLQDKNLCHKLPPLHLAAFCGLCSWAEDLLVVRRADPNEFVEMPGAGGPLRMRPLHYAAYNPSFQMLKLLLEHKADIQADPGSGGTPIFLAWCKSDPSYENIKLMLQHNADRTVLFRGMNAIHFLAHKGNDPRVLELLLDSDGDKLQLDINSPAGAQKNAPLHHLCVRNGPIPLDLLRALVERGADVNVENLESERPVQLVCDSGDLAALKVLCDGQQQITDIDDRNTLGYTALHAAANRNYTSCMEVLFQSGAKVNMVGINGHTALHLAASGGSVEAVELLLRHGADVSLTANDNLSALHYACNINLRATDTMRLILAKMLEDKIPMSRINGSPADGYTLLSKASNFGQEEIVAKLIECAKSSNDVASLAIDSQGIQCGKTALHFAAQAGHAGCVRRLLEMNANIRLPDKVGLTALTLARVMWSVNSHMNSFEEILEMLIEKDPTTAVEDSNLIAVCAMNGSMKLLELLQRFCANFSRPDWQGWTPLQLAKDFGHIEAVRFLERPESWGDLVPTRWQPPPAPLPHPSTHIKDFGLSFSHTVKSQICIRADKPVPPGLGRFYFEVILEQPGPGSGESNQLPSKANNPIFAIGFCGSDNFTAIQFPGWPSAIVPNARSWAYHSDDGGLYEGVLGGLASIYETPYEPGMTVGCGVDMTTHTIWFTCNGQKLDGELKNVQGRMYPMLGLDDVVDLTTKFKGPFSWKGDNI